MQTERWRLKCDKTELGMYSGKFVCATSRHYSTRIALKLGLRLMKGERKKDCQKSAFSLSVVK